MLEGKAGLLYLPFTCIEADNNHTRTAESESILDLSNTFEYLLIDICRRDLYISY
jgi:hypothetical protein